MDLEDLHRRYLQRNPRSAAFFAASGRRIPGGVEGGIKFFRPFPLAFARADGPYLEDLDGHRYVDFLLSFGAIALGHGHPAVAEAVARALAQYGTTSVGMPLPIELEMAERIHRLFPSIDTLRFTNSGLEATLLAVRLGLAFSGRSHVAKFAGHYHGGHEQVLVTSQPLAQPLGEDPSPQKVPSSWRLPEYYLEHTLLLPFNDLTTAEQQLSRHRQEVGVVILEPVEAGVVPAEPGFLEGLREMTRALGMVLVFDEVKTGLRVALGGAQAHYGVAPDLTVLGKVLGGGYPIGAVGGRAEIMELLSPTRPAGKVVFHSGTFNGNPVSLAAGLAALDTLEMPGAFPELVERTAQLRRGIEAEAAEARVALSTVGLGTIFDVVLTDRPIRRSADIQRGDLRRREMLDFHLMERGVFGKPLHRFSLSMAHGEEEILATLSAFREGLRAIRQA